MGSVQGLLTRKLGGIPAWAWGLIGGGLIVAYVWISRRGGDGPTPAPAAPTTDDTAAADAGDIDGLPTVTPTVSITTNPAWQRYVEDAAVAAGEDPVLVHNAITKVLGGLEVSTQEKAMWSTLVTRYGPPPEGAPPIVVTPTPPPPPPPPATPVNPRGLPVSHTLRPRPGVPLPTRRPPWMTPPGPHQLPPRTGPSPIPGR